MQRCVPAADCWNIGDGQLSLAPIPRPSFLERSDKAHPSFVNQFLQLAAILDGSVNLRHEILWDVNGEPSAFVTAVQRIAAMTLAGGASLTILSDAWALPQRQRTGGHWPMLPDGVEKPAAETVTVVSIHSICESIHI